MLWRTTSDPASLDRRAAAFLRSRPVLHAPLIVELAFLVRHPRPAAVQRYGWCEDGDTVVGVFVQGPGHLPMTSDVPPDAVPALATILGDATAIGVPEAAAEDVVTSWAARGVALSARRRFVVWEATGRPGPRPLGPGLRPARAADRPLLHSWFDAFRAAHPDDPSDRAFVVDDPLANGGIVLAVEDSVPRAMASRSAVRSGVARLGLAWQPDGGTSFADRAVEGLIDGAVGVIPHVVALSADADGEAQRWFARGFRAAGARIVLGRDVSG